MKCIYSRFLVSCISVEEEATNDRGRADSGTSVFTHGIFRTLLTSYKVIQQPFSDKHAKSLVEVCIVCFSLKNNQENGIEFHSEDLKTLLTIPITVTQDTSSSHRRVIFVPIAKPNTQPYYCKHWIRAIR